jgi:hypothetical protein
MKRFKQLVRETAVEPDMPSAAARTYKEKPNKEPMEKLKEGRLSQRHPLEGHEYHKKTDAELVHIAKDAHKAAEAMKSHNTDAENKYRDQANDSATVRYFRKKSGMPDWYKKKYGHVKEETEQQKHPFVAVHAKKGMHQTHGSTSYEAAQNAAKHWKMKNTAGIDVYRADKKHIPEEVEQIDELSNELLGRYKDKAVVSHGEAEKAKNYKLSDKRFSGVVKATNKQFANFRKKPFSVKEEIEQLDELSKSTLGSYATKAADDARVKKDASTSLVQRYKGYSSKSFEKSDKADKRLEGVKKAVSRLTKEETEQLEEVRTAQSFGREWGKRNSTGARRFNQDHIGWNSVANEKRRGLTVKKIPHPKGHDADYHVAVDKDENEKGYFDHHTMKGMIKEETEQLDEISAETKASYTQKATKDIEQLKPHAEKGEYKDIAKNIIKKREKGIAMAKEEKEPPFDPDPPKKQQVVPGKHGAGYSTARHLARQAMKKQVEKMKPVKESLEESRKAEIVKEIVKKKKNEKNNTETFQKDPVLSSEITKA